MSDNQAVIPTSWKAGIAIGAVLLIAGAIIYNFWLGPMIFMQNQQAGQDIVESEMNSDAAIDNYEWFKQQKYDIEAKERQANNTKTQMERMEGEYDGGPSDWDSNTQDRYEDLRNQLLGQQNMHNQMVADYNARSEMQNRAAFKDKLPYNMEQKFWVGDGR